MTLERKENLLIIDGNNLAFRVGWTHRDLSYNDSPVSVLFGFFKSLIRFKRDFPDYFTIVVWDRGHHRRDVESQKGVDEGIIDSVYKANRKKEEPDPIMESLFEQIDILRKDALPLVKVLQAEARGYEADDLAYTYAMQNIAAGGKTVIVTSDKDYFQLLGKGVVVYDAMKDELWNHKKFTEEFGFEPEQWVDAGGIAGDKGDNIHGVPGVGMVTACKLIREFGSLDGVIAGLQSKEKRGKREEDIINNIPRMRLAYSLKQMDMVPFPPRLRYHGSYDVKKVEEYFLQFRFVSLIKDAKYLV